MYGETDEDVAEKVVKGTEGDVEMTSPRNAFWCESHWKMMMYCNNQDGFGAQELDAHFFSQQEFQ